MMNKTEAINIAQNYFSSFLMEEFNLSEDNVMAFEYANKGLNDEICNAMINLFKKAEDEYDIIPSLLSEEGNKTFLQYYMDVEQSLENFPLFDLSDSMSI